MALSEEHLQAITEKVEQGRYRLSLHAEKERRRDKIKMAEIQEALKVPELLEDYPDDPRGPSCLLLGFSTAGEPIHLVAGELLTEGPLVIITVYRPDPNQWQNWRSRK